MNLTDVYRSPRKRRRRFRVGRGESSGLGKTSGKGHKGQHARAGTPQRAYFEGGQMPLVRRIPKRGFNNKTFATYYVPVAVGDLERFPDGSTVDLELLRKVRLVRQVHDGVKILGGGKLTRRLTVRAKAFSASAKAAIEKAGGKAEAV